MTHLLDTDSCVHYLRFGAGSKLAVQLDRMPLGDIALCSIVVAELFYGAWRTVNVARTVVQVRDFCQRFPSLPFDDAAAEEYGKLRAHLASTGQMIGPNDLMIASIAPARGLILVTHNVREFHRVPGLVVEDWQGP